MEPSTRPPRAREAGGFEVAAVLFDLDGVLVLSAGSIRRAWTAWARRHGLAWEAVAPHVPGRHAVDTIRAVLPGRAEELVERDARWVNERQVHDVADVAPVAGMPELVAALAPPAAWAVVTGCPRALAVARLRAGAYPDPPVLVAAEDTRRGKPAPDGYLRAAARLGVDPRSCLVVEDAPAGIEAARAAGMPVVAVRTTHRPAELLAADVVVAAGSCLGVHCAGGRLRVVARPGPGPRGPEGPA